MKIWWIWIVLLSIVAADSVKFVEHFYGYVRGDNYQYFMFTVPPGVFNVDATVILGELGPRTPPLLLIKKDSIPTEFDFDYQWNTTVNQTYISNSIPDLQVGTYFATMWGGNILGSINNFGAGPSIFMWWFLEFAFYACDDLDKVGPKCNIPVITTSKSNIASTAFKEGEITSQCVDKQTPTRIFSFKLLQPAPVLNVDILLLVASYNVKWALYHNRANALDKNTTALQKANSTILSRFSVDRPQQGTYHIVVTADKPSGLCASGFGISFDLAWTTSACADNDVMCAMNYEIMDINRDTATPSDDFIVSASFASNTPITSGGYVVDVPAMYAGATFTVNLVSNISSGSIYIRLDGFPTLSMYDYRLNISEAFPVDDPTLSPFNPQNPPPTAIAVVKNTATNVSFLSFDPIYFPKVGKKWYIALVPDESTNWMATLNIKSLACPPEYSCSDKGSCAVKTSYQGLSYGQCMCHYGYGGQHCQVSVYTSSERLGRSWFLLLSNGAIAPASIYSWRRKLYVEAVLFMGLGVISGLYHACDLQIFCIFSYSFLQAMDFTFTFNAIILGFIHLSGAFKHVKAGMQIFVFVSLIFMTTYNSTSLTPGLTMYDKLNTFFVFSREIYLDYEGKFTTPCELLEVLSQLCDKYINFVPSAFKCFLLKSDNFEYRYLLLGLALFGGAFGCFFTESGTEYWLIHSIWHLTAMLSAFAFMALRKNLRYRCVNDEGIDVLSHEYTISLEKQPEKATVNQVNPVELTSVVASM
ncbi:hypothetical protein THRCLA_05893 [Thraustotheca clavata]|uniref:EGF-like domain-containing protein n=1 Tax=Thraustotheca clavata TaxID=74557 RepID=A0A1V9ZRQ9_9STRA|nr:hypothetical protein THRCLA_05893 [Thraustotheca clavata]